MQTHELIPHPEHLPLAVSGVVAGVGWSGPDWLTLRWRIEGSRRVVIPPFAGRHRRDGLWRTTCFELFLRNADGGYAEFNFSPSQSWAAYDFTGHREGMTERNLSRRPIVGWRGGRSGLALFDVALPRSALPEGGNIGLSAVIEEEGGVKSFWALGHPHGQPDFHDPACFVASLPAPELS